jgi:hypothetical protein
VLADYLIAADGNRSRVRERLGIERPGYRVTQPLLSILFDADLDDIIQKRALFWIVRNQTIGFGGFVSTATPGRWAVSIQYDPAESVPTERMVAAIRAVTGKPDLDPTIVDATGWEEAVGVAERYRQGRVFLVGDAAHVWPPAGGFGANSAVQDSHNLSWKLAAVLAGHAGDELLDSYEAERRPVALELARLTVARQEARFGRGEDSNDVDDLVCVLGQRYQSSALLDATHTGVFSDRMHTAAEPGLRAPHLWVTQDGVRVALHDLFGTGFVLLTDEAGTAWLDAAARTGLPVRAYRIGTGDVDLVDVDQAWPDRSGVDEGGAVLVRPDGYVSWCGDGSAEDPHATLAGVLHSILGKPAIH